MPCSLEAYRQKIGIFDSGKFSSPPYSAVRKNCSKSSRYVKIDSVKLTILVALIDWFEDATMGALPSIAGVSLLSPLFSLLLGKIADSVNHLVFTMPFLPSEGVPAVALVDGKPRDVLLFRYLPILWYKHPIPNDLREYWFTERRDILEFMQNAYKNVDIQFLPDSMLDHSFNLQRILENLLAR